MALVRTNRFGGTSATGFGTGAYTTTSFTPASGSLLVVVLVAAVTGSITFAPTISDSTGRTWTQQLTVSLNTLSWTHGIRVWTAPIVTGTSMTVSADHGATSVANYSMAVLEYNGHDTTTPIAGVVTNTVLAVNGAASLTLTATPVAGDEEVGCLLMSPNTGTPSSSPGSTFTEQYDLGTSGADSLELETRTGSTSTTVDWVDTQTGTTDIFRQMGGAFIVKAATSGPTSTAGQVATLNLQGVTATVTVGAVSTAGQTATVNLQGVSSGTSLAVSHTTTPAVVNLQGVSSTATVGAVTVAGQTATLNLQGVAGVGSAGGGSPQSTAGQTATVNLQGVASTASVGAVSTAGQIATVQLVGVHSAATVGAVTVAGQTATLNLQGVAGSGTTPGAPQSVAGQTAVLNLQGVHSVGVALGTDPSLVYPITVRLDASRNSLTLTGSSTTTALDDSRNSFAVSNSITGVELAPSANSVEIL